MNVRIKLAEHAYPPLYASPGAAGADLYVHSPDTAILRPGDRILVDTGVAIELPIGYSAEIRPRSGFGVKYGIVTMQGTIDRDYRGYIKVLLMNLGNQAFILTKGDRVAQLVIQATEQAQWDIVSELTGTQRGTNGFGSTGRV
jgi:dUTP pyrophosphatase